MATSRVGSVDSGALPPPIVDAPSTMTVFTPKFLESSPAANYGDLLRGVPGVNVTQLSARDINVTARGATSSLSTSQLAVVDGRSLYQDFFGFVMWDFMPANTAEIKQIEVIRGPASAVWGANAVNGVINVITRKSGATQGGLVQVQAGDLGRGLALRYGGRIGDSLAYRVYAKSFVGENTVTSAGGKAHDQWSKPQAGFRLDWTPSPDDALTLQGDGYEGSEAQGGAMDEQISGRNLLLRWNRSREGGSDLQVQAYYDRTRRETPGNGSFTLDTYDLDLQHSFSLGARNQIVWGGGYRNWDDRFVNTGNPFVLVPESERLSLTNIFAQDTIALRDGLRLVLGSKFEYSTFAGWAAMTNVRIGWQADDRNFLWGAVSRAVRSPSRLERDLSALGG